MTCDFYWISGSPFSWRVHLALEYKQISYRSHLLNANEGEHKTPEFLKLNPRGRVPVLRDGESIIFESVAILAYLESSQPGTRLFGSSHIETGQIWQRILEIENYTRNPLLHLTIAILGGRLQEKQDEIGELHHLCRAQLDWIESVLTKSSWIGGETISAADFVLYPVLMIFLRVTDTTVSFFGGQWPVTADWAARIEKLPGYNKTYPPHWWH